MCGGVAARSTRCCHLPDAAVRLRCCSAYPVTAAIGIPDVPAAHVFGTWSSTYTDPMGICICGITALEVYRASGRLLPDVLARPRTATLDVGPPPSATMLADDLTRLGARTTPYHLAIDSAHRIAPRPDIQRHSFREPFPRKAFIRLSPKISLVSPEFLFVKLSAAGDLDEIDLALIGYELCGLYVLDPDDESWTGQISTGASLTNALKIDRMIQACGGRRGIARARSAAGLIADRSNSPMETVLAALFGFPRRLGGLGLGPIEMNRKVATTTGDRWVDLFFVGKGVGLEYKGREAHSIEKVGRDDRRQNKLVGSGVAVLNVWYEDLADANLFDQLVHDVCNALGVRLRIRSKTFDHRQALLRRRLMPAIGRFGGMAPMR